jgi:hypothetical protein
MDIAMSWGICVVADRLLKGLLMHEKLKQNLSRDSLREGGIIGCSVVGGSASVFWQVGRPVAFPDTNAAA